MIVLFVFTMLAGSAWMDVRTGKIPNGWLLFCTLCLLAAQWIRGPSFFTVWEVGGILSFGIQAMLFLAIFFPLFLFRMMGAGDIKIMALIGGSLGISDGFSVLFYGLTVSAVWSLLYMIQNRLFLKRINYFLNYFKQFYQTGKISPYYQADRDKTEAGFCLAPFLWCGFCIWLSGKAGG